MLVSHDREFLARSVTRVLELDLAQHCNRVYGGGSQLTDRDVLTNRDGDAGVAQGMCVRRLVGPVIHLSAVLIVVVASLPITVARGGAFVIDQALRVAP